MMHYAVFPVTLGLQLKIHHVLFPLYIKAGMEGVGLNGRGSCYNCVVCKKKAMLSVSVMHYVLYFLEEAYCLELCCNLLPWEWLLNLRCIMFLKVS